MLDLCSLSAKGDWRVPTGRSSKSPASDLQIQRLLPLRPCHVISHFASKKKREEKRNIKTLSRVAPLLHRLPPTFVVKNRRGGRNPFALRVTSFGIVAWTRSRSGCFCILTATTCNRHYIGAVATPQRRTKRWFPIQPIPSTGSIIFDPQTERSTVVPTFGVDTLFFFFFFSLLNSPSTKNEN